MSLTIFFSVVILAFFLIRQTRIRIVPRVYQPRLPIILGVIGFFDLISYTGDHHVTAHDYLWVIGSFLVAGAGLGAVRATTVKIWTSNTFVVRQGTWLTIALWLVSVGLHFASDAGGGNAGAAHLEEASFLLFLALTYGVQNYVVHLRATPLWNALGPEAGRRMQVNFNQAPGNFGAIFTTFRSGGQGLGTPPTEDPSIIDAEVVDDDDGPSELHHPG
jgi:hypothetical protein